MHEPPEPLDEGRCAAMCSAYPCEDWRGGVNDFPEDYDPPKGEDPTQDHGFIQWMDEQDEQQRIEDEWFISTHSPDQCVQRHPALWPPGICEVEMAHFPMCAACRFRDHMDGLCINGNLHRCYALDRSLPVCHFEHTEPPMPLSEIHERAAGGFRLAHVLRMIYELGATIKAQESMMECLMSLAADMED